MFFGHLPALLGVWNRSGSVTQTLLMFAAQAFFAVMFLEVRWVRLPSDRRRLLAVIAGFTLLHARVIEHSFTHSLDSPAGWQWVMLGGVTATLGVFLRQGRRLERLRRRVVRNRSRSRVGLVFEALRHASLPPRFLMLVRRCLPDRAPPLRALS